MNGDRGSGLGCTIDQLPSATYGEANVDRQFIVLLFPVPTRLYGVFVAHALHINAVQNYWRATEVVIQVSSDTTNGVDGTWSTLLNMATSVGNGAIDTAGTPTVMYDGTSGGSIPISPINDTYRRLYPVESVGIYEVSGLNTRQVKGLRFLRSYQPTGNASVDGNATQKFVLHLYGEPDTTAIDDRIAFWQSTSDLPVTATWFDWGDVPIASSGDKQFRVKNLSDTLTATGIVLDAVPANAAGTPAADTFLLFSTDGGTTWTATATIASLSPGAVSSTILLRLVVPSNSLLSNWSPRITADVEGWV
jgi:hypothetical protein